jgi:hypothetical protein
MDEENQGAAPEAAPEPSIEQIEDKLGSFDFDAPAAPAGEARAQPEPASDEAKESLAGETEAERPAQTDDDPEVILRDNQKVKLSELKRGYRPDWEKQVRDFQARQEAFQRNAAGYNQSQQQAAGLLQNAISVLQERLPKPPDPELAKSDPFEYLQQKTQYDIDAGKLQQAKMAQAYFAQQAQQQNRQALQKRLIQERDATLTHFPDLKDPVKATKFQEDTKTLGAELGFSSRELSGINDHRLIRLIDLALKAKKYEKDLDAARAKLKAASEKPPVEVQAPQRRRTSAQVQADTLRASMSRLSKNPNSSQAAEDVLSRFD